MSTVNVRRTIIAFGVALAMVIAAAPVFGPVQAASNNLKAAMKKYKVTDDRVLTVDKASSDAISKSLDEAMGKATEKEPVIVYVKSGTVSNEGFSVSANVILVSEKAVKYNKTNLYVYGSVYGGTFDGKKSINKIIEVNTTKSSKINGNVEYATVKNASDTGISCIGSARVNSVNNNTVSGCIKGGIGAYNGAVIKYVRKNTIKNNGKGKNGSGLNIVSAKVNYIEKNKITGNKGHGISTDYEYYGKGCTIKTIDGNTVKSNGVHGIYIERSKVTKSMKNNTVTKNKKCGIRVDGKSSVKGYKNNNVKGNKGTGLSNAGKISKK